jgi:hypothetical protein
MSTDDNGPLPRLSNCPTCAGMGWVCEEHMDRPWQHDGCGGAGVGCLCNPALFVPFEEVLAEVDEDDERTDAPPGSLDEPPGRYLGSRQTRH